MLLFLCLRRSKGGNCQIVEIVYCSDKIVDCYSPTKLICCVLVYILQLSDRLATILCRATKYLHGKNEILGVTEQGVLPLTFVSISDDVREILLNTAVVQI